MDTMIYAILLIGAAFTLFAVRIIFVKDGEFNTQSLQRSSLETAKMDIAHTIGASFQLMGCDVEHDGSYPGWDPNSNSEILYLMK